MSSYFNNDFFHVAYVGTDLDKMVDRMLQSGIGPFYYSRDLHLNALYRGERHDLVISVAFAYIDDQMIELVVQDNDAPSSFREYLDRHPDGGLHHIAYMSNDLDGSIEELKRRGKEFVRVQEFLGPDGKPVEIYLEPKGAEDPIFMQIVLPSAWDGGFDKLQQAARTWDGSKPKRDMADLLPAEFREIMQPA